MCLGTTFRFEFEVAPLCNRLEVNRVLFLGCRKVVFRIFADRHGFGATNRILGLGDEDFGARWLNFKAESRLSLNGDEIAFVTRAPAPDVRIGLNRRF